MHNFTEYFNVVWNPTMCMFLSFHCVGVIAGANCDLEPLYNMLLCTIANGI